jgi:hypothetical protein
MRLQASRGKKNPTPECTDDCEVEWAKVRGGTWQ